MYLQLPREDTRSGCFRRKLAPAIISELALRYIRDNRTHLARAACPGTRTTLSCRRSSAWKWREKRHGSSSLSRSPRCRRRPRRRAKGKRALPSRSSGRSGRGRRAAPSRGPSARRRAATRAPPSQHPRRSERRLRERPVYDGLHRSRESIPKSTKGRRRLRNHLRPRSPSPPCATPSPLPLPKELASSTDGARLQTRRLPAKKLFDAARLLGRCLFASSLPTVRILLIMKTLTEAPAGAARRAPGEGAWPRTRCGPRLECRDGVPRWGGPSGRGLPHSLVVGCDLRLGAGLAKEKKGRGPALLTSKAAALPGGEGGGA